MAGKDCTRILLVNDMGVSGFAVADCLSELGIDVEMAEEQVVTMILAIGDLPQKGYMKDRVVAALQDISANHKALPKAAKNITAYLPQQEIVVLSSQLWWSRDMVSLSLMETEGKIAAEMISLYPPGVPLVLPGEEITAAVVALLEKIVAAGGSVQGYDDGKITVLAEK